MPRREEGELKLSWLSAFVAVLGGLALAPSAGHAQPRRQGSPRQSSPVPGRTAVAPSSAPGGRGASPITSASEATTQAQDPEAVANLPVPSREAITWAPSTPEPPPPPPSPVQATEAPASYPVGPYGTLEVGVGYGDSTVRANARCNEAGLSVSARLGFTLPDPGRVYLGAAFDEYFGCDLSSSGATFRSRRFAGDVGFDILVGPLVLRPFVTAGALTRFVPLSSTMSGCGTSCSGISGIVVGQNFAALGGGATIGVIAGAAYLSVEGRFVHALDTEGIAMSVAGTVGVRIR